jgi:hypothetical protein
MRVPLLYHHHNAPSSCASPSNIFRADGRVVQLVIVCLIGLGLSMAPTARAFIGAPPTPAPPSGDGDAACEDDPNGMLVTWGGCAVVVLVGCETDLRSLNPNVAEGAFVKLVCPASCDECSSDGGSPPPSPPPSGDGGAACVDDPTGQLAPYGGCGTIVAMGCDLDLNILSGSVSADHAVAPVGSFVHLVCPMSCDICHSGETGSSTSPVPTATASSLSCPAPETDGICGAPTDCGCSECCGCCEHITTDVTCGRLAPPSNQL